MAKSSSNKAQHIDENLPEYQVLHIDNITATHAPLLKVYYWEAFDVDGLNTKLKSNVEKIMHKITIPTMQINSRPLKIVLWVRNESDSTLDICIKRVKNCACEPMQTRIGFNQFRALYQCPHRRLVYFQHEYLHMPPNDVVALSVIIYTYLYGKYVLSYELMSSDSRLIHLDFCVDIFGFDPQKCILTKELLPVDIHNFERVVQPLWVRNVTMQQLQVVFCSQTRGLKLINPNLTVPPQSVWPLMLEYRPSHTTNSIQLTMNQQSILYTQTINANGYLTTPEPDPIVPDDDYNCVDFPFVMYPNRVEFTMTVGDLRSKMVAISNHSQKCMEFHWQNYIINQTFDIVFEPNIFRLKPHHTKLCTVTVKSYTKLVQFKRIPAVLEVHRVFSRCRRIARELITEVESIDDPNLTESSYVDHVFLHVNIIVEPEPRGELNELELALEVKIQTTVFERLFWEALARTKFMRENKNPVIRDDYKYDEVLQLHTGTPIKGGRPPLQRNETLEVLSQLLASSVRELAKGWRFIPAEECIN